MRNYIITQFVCVKLDEAKFTPEFLREYCENFCNLPTIEDHRRHLAKMFAHGLIEGRDNEFVEGYGVLSEMGIELTYVDDTEIGPGIEDGVPLEIDYEGKQSTRRNTLDMTDKPDTQE